MSEREASNFMIKMCQDAYNKWTTAGYDLIQYLQQGIEKQTEILVFQYEHYATQQ